MGKIEARKIKAKNQQEVTVRVALESDAAAFLALGKSVMDEEIYTLTQSEELTLTVEQEAAWIKGHLDTPAHLCLVVEADGEIIGQLNFTNGHRARIAHTGEFGMGVHKNWRGVGIGTLLLSTLVEWARSQPSLEKINLFVHATNDRAITMYKNQGFEIEGLRRKDLKYPNGIYVDTVLMGLIL